MGKIFALGAQIFVSDVGANIAAALVLFREKTRGKI